MVFVASDFGHATRQSSSHLLKERAPAHAATAGLAACSVAVFMTHGRSGTRPKTCGLRASHCSGSPSRISKLGQSTTFFKSTSCRS